ncbi:MAG: hypothetical protein KKE76_10475 [Gammaproteobacteria bacterium]|nr:hypothetical protein [Gammaproteobacteria bacterium]
MNSKVIDGIGLFNQGDGCWEAEPEALQGALLSIETTNITSEIEARAKLICAVWSDLIPQCIEFIEVNREKYHLCATQFTNPNVFIDSDNEWAIYFDTESEIDAVVGVEFMGNEPFQLIIGD